MEIFYIFYLLGTKILFIKILGFLHGSGVMHRHNRQIKCYNNLKVNFRYKDEILGKIKRNKKEKSMLLNKHKSGI